MATRSVCVGVDSATQSSVVVQPICGVSVHRLVVSVMDVVVLASALVALLYVVFTQSNEGLLLFLLSVVVLDP